MTRKLTEFEEIAHSGGKVTFRVVTNAEGRRSYQVTISGTRPVPMALIAVYALREGLVVDTIKLGGIGTPWNAPPVPNCIPVFIASDSQGLFGCQCPSCKQYWRCREGAIRCPYCGVKAQRHQFLTDAQKDYAFRYCERLNEALDQEEDGEHVIDMDAVSAAAGRDVPKPPFYYAEESQQNQFKCDACGASNDILGKFGYCAICGTRNDLSELVSKTVPAIRERINNGDAYELYLRESASAFDTLVSQYVKQLLQYVPMTSSRQNRLEQMRFHNLDPVSDELRSIFDIDILAGIKDQDRRFAARMFQRRHLYEHNGGEVDEKYLADSGDTSVRLKQAIHESQQSTHEFLNVIVRMARNLHRGFHELLPPEHGPIAHYARTHPRQKNDDS